MPGSGSGLRGARRSASRGPVPGRSDRIPAALNQRVRSMAETLQEARCKIVSQLVVYEKAAFVAGARQIPT